MFKNRGTIAKAKHIKNCKNVHWLYIVKMFELSAVRIQPSVDMNDKNENYNYTMYIQKLVRLYKEYIKTGKNIHKSVKETNWSFLKEQIVD